MRSTHKPTNLFTQNNKTSKWGLAGFLGCLVLAFAIFLAFQATNTSEQTAPDGVTLVSWVVNEDHGIIENATVNAGDLLENHGVIDNVTVNDGGMLENYDFIDYAVMTGGTVHNAGRMEEVLYVGGTYHGWIGDDLGVIGTLIVAGEWRTGENWGIIENLVFADNGSGLLVITAFDTPDGVLFADIGAQHIDFTNGRVLLDMSGLGNIRNVLPSSFTNVFGGATVDGMLSAFAVTDGAELFPIIVDGVLLGGWSIDPTTGEVRGPPGFAGNFNIGESDGLISYVLDMLSFAGLGGDTAMVEMLGVSVAEQNQAADGGSTPAAQEDIYLFSVTQWENINVHYVGFNLDDFADYNIIEIAAGQLSAEALQAAINIAAQTEQNDLIIVRTDAHNNTITLYGNPITIDIDSARFGSVTIITLPCSDALIVDTQNMSRAFRINSGVVALGGMEIHTLDRISSFLFG